MKTTIPSEHEMLIIELVEACISVYSELEIAGKTNFYTAEKLKQAIKRAVKKENE